MSLTSQPNVDDERCSLITRMDNAKNMSVVLKAIHFKDMATFFITDDGVKATVEDAKCVQANAFIHAPMFQEFVLKEKQISFSVSLSVMLECLNIFGSNPVPGQFTAIRMYYTEYGEPLTLVLEESGVITDCSLKTLEADDTLDFNFESSKLDWSSDVLQLVMSPDKPHLQISTFGDTGSMQVRYKLSLLKPSVKALQMSTRVSIRTDTRGFLSLQYMIKNEDGEASFVEYLFTPDEDMPDE